MRLHCLSIILLLASLSASAWADYPDPVAGDLNVSGEVNALDVQLVINGALGLETGCRTDVDYIARRTRSTCNS